MRQKKGFLLRDFVIAGILFGLVLALFILQVAGVASNYDNQEIISQSFSQHYNQIQNNFQMLDKSTSAVQGSSGLNLVGTFSIAFNSVFTVITMIWDSLLIYTGMASHLSSDFTFLDKSVVNLFLTGIISILTAYLIFVWLSSVTRGKI